MTIYRVDTKMENPDREHHDLYTNYDDAMSYYNGVKNNQDCKSIEVTRLEDTEDFSRFEEVEIVASYS